MNSVCPEKLELYSFIDGEVSWDHCLEIDQHVRSCSPCRDQLREISRIQGQLFSRPDVRGTRADDTEFVEHLLSRMMTTVEARGLGRRSASSTLWPLVAAASILAIAWFWPRNPTMGNNTGPVLYPSPDTKSVRQLARQRLDVELVNFLVRRVETPDAVDSQLGVLRSRFEDFDFALDVRLGRLLGRSDRGLDFAVIDALGRVGGTDVVGRLERFLRRHHEDPEYRSAVIRALARVGGESALRTIMRQVGRGLPLDEVLPAMLATDAPGLEKALARVVRGSGPGEVEQVVVALEGVESPGVTASLLELYLAGRQSDRLLESLLLRQEALPLARQCSFAQTQEVSRRRRAIELLGLYGDRESADELVDLVRDPGLGQAAARALAQVSERDSMLGVARGLSLSRPARSRRTNKNQSMLRECISGFGASGAHLYLEEVFVSSSPFDANYVLAAGFCRAPDVLPELETLLQRDDLKIHVVHAIGLIGDNAARRVLARLMVEGDHRVRRAARTVLERLQTAPGGTQSARGYV